jgi:hypothetical protein
MEKLKGSGFPEAWVVETQATGEAPTQVWPVCHEPPGYALGLNPGSWAHAMTAYFRKSS